MRCPKCQYISFENGARCRNCGYDFSLSETPTTEPQDLPIQNGSEPLGPFTELTLRDGSPSMPAALPADEPVTRSAPGRPATSSLDLPLFRERAPAKSEAAVVTPPAVSPPLSVRRAAPVVAKPRPRRSETATEDDEPEPRLALETAEMAVVRPSSPAESAAAVAAAPIVSRLLGGAIDLAIMGGINFIVLYFTLKICELTFAEWSRLPLAPLITFLLMIDGGYLATFVAAGGQTIGKMATGIRVIPGHPDAGPTDRVPLGQAIVRAACYAVSALPAGLGFLPGLIAPEYRALHDRLADTRVVKA
jgi:uncharacterized RDD family membrane protein YckC